MNPKLGLILLFEGDYRRVNAAIKNVTSFTAVTGKLALGDMDVYTTYITDVPTFVGNMLVTGRIGDKATIPQGSYRHFLSATSSGKVRTWYWDVLVLPKNISLMAGRDVTAEDYDPLVEEITVYEADNFAKQLTVPGVEFSAASGVLTRDGTDVTATYCAGSASYSGDTLTTHDIGGGAALVAGEYGYYITGTYHDSDVKATWYWKIIVLPKQGVL